MSEYLHGFEKKEQERLMHQARFLEPYVFDGIDLEDSEHLLEVGCGVGAQSKILCRRFPDLKITGVDLSEAQLSLARKNLAEEIKDGRVVLKKQDAQKLRVPGKFDSAFICWFLEHVPKPIEVLKKTRKHLKPGSKVYISEVFNQTLFVDPYSPAFIKYWFEFNDLQWMIKGHPFIGVQLGNLLQEAGFKDIQMEPRPFHFDSRNPKKREAFTEYFYQILLSAEKGLLDSGRVTTADLKKMKKEVELVKKSKDAVFFYAFMRATARA